MHDDATATETPDRDPVVLDPALARRVLRRRAERIERAERQRALDRLEADRALSPAEREIIGDLASAIVDGVLATPAATLRETDALDRETTRAISRLFDVER